MKIIFIDAENIGLKALKDVNTSILDKVFVFSKNEGIQQYCNKSLFINITDYPTGPNQADFLIISYLSRIVANLKEDELKIIFELVTNDEALISAYESICQSFNVLYQIIRTNKKEELPIEEDVSDIVSLFLAKIENIAAKDLEQEKKLVDQSYMEELHQEKQKEVVSSTNAKEVILLEQVNAEKKILKALNQAQSLNDTLRQQLTLSKSVFSRAANALIKNNKIQRVANNKRKWIIK